jgi:hypothetical protein
MERSRPKKSFHAEESSNAENTEEIADPNSEVDLERVKGANRLAPAAAEGTIVFPETSDLFSRDLFLCNHLPLFALLTMRPVLSVRLDSVSVECKSICLV